MTINMLTLRMNTKQKLAHFMKTDVLTFKMLENWALTQFRMDNNPCEQLRVWLKKKEIALRVDYMETSVPVSPGKVVEWIGDKTVPMLVVHAVKVTGYHLGVEIYLVDKTELSRPSKDRCACVPMPKKCHHCGKVDDGIELDEDTYADIDYHGPQCLPEIDQAVYEGMIICPDCYSKEGGIC